MSRGLKDFHPSINTLQVIKTGETMTYYSTKTYGHNIGLACVFRQPNADHSHCHLLHGYSLHSNSHLVARNLTTRTGQWTLVDLNL